MTSNVTLPHSCVVSPRGVLPAPSTTARKAGPAQSTPPIAPKVPSTSGTTRFTPTYLSGSLTLLDHYPALQAALPHMHPDPYDILAAHSPPNLVNLFCNALRRHLYDFHVAILPPIVTRAAVPASPSLSVQLNPVAPPRIPDPARIRPNAAPNALRPFPLSNTPIDVTPREAHHLLVWVTSLANFHAAILHGASLILSALEQHFPPASNTATATSFAKRADPNAKKSPSTPAQTSRQEDSYGVALARRALLHAGRSLAPLRAAALLLSVMCGHAQLHALVRAVECTSTLTFAALWRTRDAARRATAAYGGLTLVAPIESDDDGDNEDGDDGNCDGNCDDDSDSGGDGDDGDDGDGDDDDSKSEGVDGHGGTEHYKDRKTKPGEASGSGSYNRRRSNRNRDRDRDGSCSNSGKATGLADEKAQDKPRLVRGPAFMRGRHTVRETLGSMLRAARSDDYVAADGDRVRGTDLLLAGLTRWMGVRDAAAMWARLHVQPVEENGCGVVPAETAVVDAWPRAMVATRIVQFTARVARRPPWVVVAASSLWGYVADGQGEGESEGERAGEGEGDGGDEGAGECEDVGEVNEDGDGDEVDDEAVAVAV